MNNDIEMLKEQVSWLFYPKNSIQYEPTEILLTGDFYQVFPKLSNLISKARILSVKINAVPYYLFSWDNSHGQICSWLNKISTESSCDLIEEHRILLQNIGGIQESFNQPEKSFTLNQDFLFIGSECEPALGGYEDYYFDLCANRDLKPMDFSKFVIFAQEANGAQTLYNFDTKKVLLFSHDHYFDYVDFLEGQPEYTFHTIRSVDSFVDYVEMLAAQWEKLFEK